eukprot:TRINITY_DN2534_c0_g1_i7.p1 TRINITY_DN2534_c0_g1~~TRINITY_DN2534_c0_g1_i7.p1  ORF type:complete len:334 (+),score=68.04 TRINITY_DN2534_c0_g1_i7:369-1370(+)
MNRLIADYALAYDPLDPELESLERFRVAKQNSQCIFAKAAKIWGAPNFDTSQSLEYNVLRMMPMFLKFTLHIRNMYPKTREIPKKIPAEMADGFLFEIRGEQYLKDVYTFGQAISRIVHYISDHDPVSIRRISPPGQPESFPVFRGCLHSHALLDTPSWHFNFLKEPYFLTTFAPFYPPNNSRFMFPHAGNQDSGFLLFQPELSFLYHDIGFDTPLTNWEQPVTVRDKIRVAFRQHGREYEIPPTISYPTSHHTVKQLHEHDPVVKWWHPDGGRAFAEQEIQNRANQQQNKEAQIHEESKAEGDVNHPKQLENEASVDGDGLRQRVSQSNASD